MDTEEADGGGCKENEELVRDVLDNWPRFMFPKAFVGGGAIEGEVTVDAGGDDHGLDAAAVVAAPQLMPVLVLVGEVMVDGVGWSG